jgi:hypothetical protein
VNRSEGTDADVEIVLDLLGRARELRRRARQLYLALVQEVAPVDGVRNDLDVLLDQQDGDVGLPDLPDDVDDWLDDLRRQALHWLVEEHQFRIADHRHGDDEHLPLAAAQFARALVRALCESLELVEDMRHVPVIAVAGVDAACLPVARSSRSRRHGCLRPPDA